MVYKEPPWCFSGRAFYQLQLVKLDEARKYIPPEFKIVSAFGYTLGGFYLARYSDSPVGAFDELVVLSGLIWDFPASCAWAARVYVNDREARTHGRQHVGLPSRVASFTPAPMDGQEGRSQPSWWNEDEQQLMRKEDSTGRTECQRLTIKNEERVGRKWFLRSGPRQMESPICCLSLPAAHLGRKGPKIRLPLPSFSGGTPDHPGLLQYTVKLKANVRPVKAARISASLPEGRLQAPAEAIQKLLTGRPVIAFAFDNMEMSVAQPSEPQKFQRRLEAYVPQLNAVC